jgi:hypothetical protein
VPKAPSVRNARASCDAPRRIATSASSLLSFSSSSVALDFFDDDDDDDDDAIIVGGMAKLESQCVTKNGRSG